jgi:DNA-damage-inducible protein J
MVANVNIRVEDSLKKSAENIFAELGMSMSTATNVFYRQVVRSGGIPFDLRVSDPFYSAKNQARLKKTIDNYTSGKSKPMKKTMEELIEMENE